MQRHNAALTYLVLRDVALFQVYSRSKYSRVQQAGRQAALLQNMNTAA